MRGWFVKPILWDFRPPYCLLSDLIAHGLSHASLVDHSWITDRACWIWPRSLACDTARPATVERQFDTGSPSRMTLDETALSAYAAAVLPTNEDLRIPAVIQACLISSTGSFCLWPFSRPFRWNHVFVDFLPAYRYRIYNKIFQATVHHLPIQWDSWSIDFLIAFSQSKFQARSCLSSLVRLCAYMIMGSPLSAPAIM